MASPAPDLTIHDLETALRGSPLGMGMEQGRLADLFDSVRNKVLNLSEARTVVAEVFRTQPLRVDEAITYATRAREMSAYDARSAVVLATLLRDAAAMTLPSETDALTLIDLAYVRCWSIWLRRVPDGRIYREVAGIVDDLVRRCEVGSGLHGHYGLALASSAQLRSVFASYGDAVTWWDDLTGWRSLIDGALTAGDIALSPLESEEIEKLIGASLDARIERDVMMPDAADELAGALTTLTEGDSVLTGDALAHNYLLRLTVERYCLRPGQVLDPNYVIRLCSDALPLIEVRKTESRVAAASWIVRSGGTIPVPASRLVPDTMAQLMQRVGVFEAQKTFRLLTDVLHAVGDEAELRSVGEDAIEADLAGAVANSDRIPVLYAILHALTGMVDCPQQRLDSAAAATALLRSAKTDEQRYWAELHAALHCATPELAAQIMQTRIVRVRPQLRAGAVSLKRFVMWMVSTYYAADEQVDVGSRVRAIVTVIRLAAELNVLEWDKGVALELLSGLCRERPGAAEGVLDELPAVIDRILIAAADEPRRWYAGLGGTVGGALLKQETLSANQRLVWSQLFKGRLSSVSMANSGPLPPSDESTDLLLTQMTGIRRWRDEAGASAEETYDRESAALSYARRSDRASATDLAGQMLNVGRTFDLAFERHLFEAKAAQQARRSAGMPDAGLHARHGLSQWTELCHALDERTALLDLSYVDTEWGAGLTASVLSPSLGARFSTTLFGSSFGEVEAILIANPTLTTRQHLDAGRAERLRSAILEAPHGQRPVTREGQELLDEYLGWLDDHLGEFAAAGISRLVTWPHGPLHHVPLHLATVNGRPLAETFGVTTIPNLSVLTRNGDRAAPRTGRTVLAAASNGGSRYALPDVTSLAEGTSAIAEFVGRDGEVNLCADSQWVRDRAPSARFVHLAAHGTADPQLPWSQCLFLGDGNHDDRLMAYEILQLDLRGVELVTLAACETAVGRFDRLDDQSGLAAALLTAGARAVVATLWPVRPEPTTLFFTELYRSLWGASSDLDLRAAYYRAQAQTRGEFPAHRDWGAFVYIGGW